MNNYTWAQNKIKLARAITLAGTDATEERVKEQYIKIGGLIIKTQNTIGVEILKEAIAAEDSMRRIEEGFLANNSSVTVTQETIAIPVLTEEFLKEATDTVAEQYPEKGEPVEPPKKRGRPKKIA